MLLRHSLPILLGAFPAILVAQNDFDLDKRTAGALGSTLTLGVANAPANNLGVAMVSFNSGPTNLANYVPGETRSVQVGTELIGAWYVYATNGSGAANFNLNLPTNPAYHDLRFSWQTLMLNSSGPVIGQISNSVRTQASIAGQGLLAPAGLLAGRAFGAGFFDRDNDAGAGDFVVAGGGSGSLTSATGLATSERWNFRTMTVSPGATMGTARALHLPVRLNDGRVLVIGGADDTGTVLSTCEIYDPVSNSFSNTGSMATPRVLHAACLLADGRVMVAGGTSSLVDTVTAITSTLSSAEIFNPATGTWSGAPSIGGRRLAPALTLLNNNQVMVSGGVEVVVVFGLPISAVSTTTVQRWNPNTNAWSSGPNMSQGRAGHQYNQVTLNDGRVLFTGGTNVPNLTGAANAAPISGAELYNPATNSWQTANMSAARALHSATKLADGRVVVCGGAQGTLTTPSSIDGVELFDPSNNSWSPLPNLTSPRSGHNGALLPDGTVLLVGGQGASATLTTIETLRL